MRDFLQRIMDARQRQSDPIMDHNRQRNTALIDGAYPGGSAAYLEANPPTPRATTTPSVSPTVEERRRRNMELMDNAYPGGAAGYQGDQERNRAENPELEQRLFGNPYVNLFNRLFNR